MAKTLYLVRHANSDWHNHLSDFDRPLNKRGLRDAPEMGCQLRKRSLSPDIIISSPAMRARQTAERLATEICVAMESVLFNDRIYEAAPETLMNIIHNVSDRFDSAMLVGHNPSMSWLADLLSGERIGGMPTCGVATLELITDSWKNAGTCPATLLDFDYPKRDHSKDEHLR